MDIEKIKSQFRKRDRVISVISVDGSLRAAIINNTQTAQKAQKNHNLSAIPGTLLAKQLAAASLLAVFLKGEERIVIETTGNGMIGKLYSEAIQVGEARGFVSFNSEDNKNELEISENPFGEGLFRISKILYSKQEPVTGVVELQSGDISSELTYYLFQSEQIPSAVILDTSTDDFGNITGSAGIIVQAMPGVSDAALDSLYEYLSKADSLNELFEENEVPESVLEKVLPFDFNIMKRDIVDFFCRCSKESFKSKLITLDLKELKSMKEQNHNEIVCQYCNTHYYLDEKDFNEIIAQVQAKQN